MVAAVRLALALPEKLALLLRMGIEGILEIQHICLLRPQVVNETAYLHREVRKRLLPDTQTKGVLCQAALSWTTDTKGGSPPLVNDHSSTSQRVSMALISVPFILSFIHDRRFLPLGSGMYSPECVLLGVPVMAAGVPTVQCPSYVKTKLQHKTRQLQGPPGEPLS